MKTAVQKYLSEIGKRGGAKSRRTLTTEQSLAMTAAREANKTKGEKMKQIIKIHCDCGHDQDIEVDIDQRGDGRAVCVCEKCDKKNEETGMIGEAYCV